MTGPRKIETDLLKLGFNDQDIKLILNDIEEISHKDNSDRTDSDENA